MSSPSTTASSIPTTPTTPFSLPSPLPNLDAAMSIKSSHAVPHLALPPPVAVRPRRVALAPSFKLQPPPASFRGRSTIMEEQEDEDGCDKLELHVPVIKAMSDLSLNKPAEVDLPRPAPLTFSNVPRIVLPTILSPSATQPNKSFADAVAGRSPVTPTTIAPSMTFGNNLSGQPRSTKAGARTHRRAQSISVSVSHPAGFAPGSGPRRAPLPGSDAQEPSLNVPSRRPTSLTPSPRAVHFAPLPESGDKRASLPARAAHPRVSALAPAHPGLSPAYGLARPSTLHPREASVPRSFSNPGRIIALPSFEDDAFTSMKGSSSYAFGMNSVAIAVGRGFEQWGE